jgi:hypothetical protein
MSENRKESIENLKNTCECNIILVTPHNLNNYILHSQPLHEAYQYLSYTHKSDYLRAYFMHFIGGGYSDVKKTTSSWVLAFKDLENDSNIYINGIREKNAYDIAYPLYHLHHTKYVSNCGYVVKPNTPFTKKWYDSMIAILDTNLNLLRDFYLNHNDEMHPQIHREINNNYPIEWNELCGRIFHKIQPEFINHIMYNVPPHNISTEYR